MWQLQKGRPRAPPHDAGPPAQDAGEAGTDRHRHQQTLRRDARGTRSPKSWMWVVRWPPITGSPPSVSRSLDKAIGATGRNLTSGPDVETVPGTTAYASRPWASRNPPPSPAAGFVLESRAGGSEAYPLFPRGGARPASQYGTAFDYAEPAVPLCQPSVRHREVHRLRHILGLHPHLLSPRLGYVRPTLMEVGDQAVNFGALDLGARLQRFADPAREALRLVDILLAHCRHGFVETGALMCRRRGPVRRSRWSGGGPALVDGQKSSSTSS